MRRQTLSTIGPCRRTSAANASSSRCAVNRINHSRAYAERVVERLLEYLIDIDNYRGTGRLYLP
ncbi:MAG TPA: hypothetical protein VN688_21550 [Gemmataceae bacterium]|nr:hypothetical protein [Gemmataceae bacterium]